MTTIISRALWGARPPRHRTFNDWPSGVDLWVHHSASATPSADASVAAESAVMREIQAFHMGPKRGWSDFAYNFAIFPSGRIFEGRGVNVQGAHSRGRNHEPAVCLIGTYTTAEPTQDARAAVWDLARIIDAGDLRGHRENTQTSCPGDGAMRAVVNAPPVEPGRPAPPDGDSLRLAIRTRQDRRAGRPGRRWAGNEQGWGAAGDALQWIARNGLDPQSDIALAWRGTTWRYRHQYPRTLEIDQRDGGEVRTMPEPVRHLRSIAATLVNRFIEEPS